ncbi:metaxin 1 [Mactra antiquata]
MDEDVVHLNVWPGEWDLPSADPNCLATLAYCRFSGVPVKIHKDVNPWRSPSGNFPWMKHKDISQTKVTDIFSYLRKQKWGSDFNLSVKQSADAVAFVALIEERLLPGFLHLWWMERDTYTNITRPFYNKATPLPFKFWIPKRYYTRAEQTIYIGQGSQNISQADIDTKVYRDAKDCLTYLSHKLGDQNYFFGDMPSSLDAIVFGYIAPLLNAPLNSNQLTNHIRTFCDNLNTHCCNIKREFFPLSLEEQKAKEKKKVEETEDTEYPNKKRNMILAGVFALTAMITFAFVHGIISIEVIEEEDPS